MTRRERIEARLARRIEWARSRDAKSAQGFAKADRIASAIPMGQPVLVGHHSEKHHRRDLERIDSGMRQGCESAEMASHHRSKADGIERQLETSIYSDDPDAVEALEAKAAAIDAEADHCKAVNAAFRKARKKEHGPDPNLRTLYALREAGTITEAEALSIAKLWALCPYHAGTPHPSYHITNLRANARRCRERIKEVRMRQERQERAEAAGGVEVRREAPRACWSCAGSGTMGEDDPRTCYICQGSGKNGAARAQVTFAEKPERDVIDALKAAGFHWSGGSWFGEADKLPACVGGAA